MLKPGEDLPKVIRQLFGESKDAKAQLIDTISDFATIVGKKTLLMILLELVRTLVG